MEFDVVDDAGKSKILRNTQWIKSQLSRYLETTEFIEETLEELQSQGTTTESPNENKNLVQIDSIELDSLKNSLNMSVDSFVSEIEKLDLLSQVG